MHRRLPPFFVALVMTLALVAAPPGVSAQSESPLRAQGPVPVADLAEELLGAVVNISTSQRVAGRRPTPLPNLPEGSPFEDFFDDFFNNEGDRDGPSRENSLGSGFIIDPDGIVVTNNHVISGADDIEVIMTDGRTFPAEVIGRDEATDLAVLRIEPDSPLPSVPFGNSDRLRIGDWVLAIGNPFGLGGSVSLGIVSAMNRNIGAGPYDSFIQTDAAINRGNSGGPLFDLAGNVVGVNTAILSPNGRSVGVGFAIPSATVETIVTQLITFGETRRGLLGVNIQEVTPDLVEGLQLDRPRGALVSVVSEGGPADEAGIERGDVIVRFNNRAINMYSDLPARVAQIAPGTEVPVGVIRRGETLTLTVILALRDGEGGQAAVLEPGPEPVSLLGMELSTVEEAYELGFEMDEGAVGAVVTLVFTDGPAAAKEIQPGTLILEVGQQVVETPQDVADRVEALRDEGRSQILMLIQDNEGQSQFVALPAD
ncbi:MAG: Do family serine endopeptidase [Rhizobiales bacterium]|nr:Do family serine endopeptidase [Hyphomicrobiales bacterium]MBO6697677.1 Do family serine endopeptidase [Hyphomicrobiales bacterium]MBO6736068.1 Do family serine endopeptidase [Hyphomicrobiales bacterium]MBO6912538.1 Do family serine endopeptidase [Hyphomicrobiales bacterium]MBO6956954.1 Do family serine endopeptidase [Hyphomicrobiales bacterium]